jgi:hypothetical protein
MLHEAVPCVCTAHLYTIVHVDCVHIFCAEQASVAASVGLARTIYIYIYTVYIRDIWQGDHQIYGHIRCYIYGSGQPYACAVDRITMLATKCIWGLVTCAQRVNALHKISSPKPPYSITLNLVQCGFLYTLNSTRAILRVKGLLL